MVRLTYNSSGVNLLLQHTTGGEATMPLGPEQVKKLEGEVEGIIHASAEFDDAAEKICRLLYENVDHYDWVGFYMVKSDEPVLELGPFVGEPTEHVKIPFGKGICGQAAQIKKTFLVSDVSAESNYLSCSPEVKSEIVVPLMKGDKVLGELDIDSHKLNAFDESDRTFLEWLCEKLVDRYFMED
ncbi:MAG TPA: histidine kinase [Thermotogae bacterium]|nr:histidine kinase [Thermotogota bacterium]